MPASQVLEFASFRLDLADERLWHGPEVLRLTPKAFAVLRCLMAQPGQMVTKAFLMDTVWPETAISESTLTGCIWELRQVLGDAARTPHYIETVHGRGYRFIAPITRAAPSAALPATAPATLHSQLSDMPAPVTLVGRAAAWVQVHQWLATARQGKRQIGFITGEVGIGKTTLVEAFVAQVTTTVEIWIGHGQCVEQYGAGEPYLPVLEALGRLCRGVDGTYLVSHLRQYAPSWLAQMPALLTAGEREALQHQGHGVTRDRMLRELSEAIDILTHERPLLLVFEDLHWCDVSTLEWMAYVARRRDPARLMILGTYRPVDALVRAHPLPTVITELLQHDHCAERMLDYLSEAAVADYLARRLGAKPFPDALPRVLHQRTNGNPLFLTTVVNTLVSQGLLEETATAWRLQRGDKPIAGIVPDSLRLLIEWYVEQLPPADQAILEAASVTGSTFSVAAVAAGIEQPVDQIEARCTAWVRQGRFLQAQGTEAWPDGTVAACYGFMHALYHEVVYQRVSAGQRMRLHQRIGARKESAYRSQARTIAAELAVHFVRGHAPQRAIHYLRSAGENAMQWGACKEAVAYFEQALEAIRHLPEHREMQEQAIDLRFALRNALLPLAAHHRILVLLREAEPLAEALDDAARLGRVCIYKEHSLALLGEDDEALEAIQRAHSLSAASGDVALQIMADARLGVLYRIRTDYQQGITILKQTLTSLEGMNPHERFGGVIPPAIFARFHLGECLAEVGSFAEALAQADEAVRIATTLEHPWAETTAHRSLGHIYLRKGDLPNAIAFLERAWQLSRASNFPSAAGVSAGLLGYAYALSGRVTEALALLEEARAQDASVIYLPALGEAYLLSGRAADASDWAQQALAYSRARQRHGNQAQALWLLGTIAMQHDLPRVHEATPYYQQALALAEACGMRPLQAHCHLGLGTLYATTGQRQQAHAALSAAMALYCAMDMAFWLPRVEAVLTQL